MGPLAHTVAPLEAPTPAVLTEKLDTPHLTLCILLQLSLPKVVVTSFRLVICAASSWLVCWVCRRSRLSSQSRRGVGSRNHHSCTSTSRLPLQAASKRCRLDATFVATGYTSFAASQTHCLSTKFGLTLQSQLFRQSSTTN